MPYHLQLTSKEPRHDNTRLDLSEKELIDTVIKPYNEGKPIFCGGRNIAADNIERMKITYSDKESSELYPIIEKELEEERRSRKLVKSIPVEWYIVQRGRDVTDRFITGPPPEQGDIKKSSRRLHHSSDTRKVWVVYGRNMKTKDAMFAFLRSLDLHPMEWEEPRAGTEEPTPYIGQVLDVAFEEAQAFIVLFTGDDEGRLRKMYQGPQDPEYERTLTPQARQNVIFEAGMAFGHDSRRTILVELGRLRPYSNIAGRHIIRMDNSSEKRHELANRLETAGCSVNRTGTDWLGSGDFETFSSNQHSPVEPYFFAEVRNKKSTYRRGEPVLFRTTYSGELTNGFFDNEIVAPQGQVFQNGVPSAWSWAPDTLDNDHPATRGNLNGLVNMHSSNWNWIIPRNAPVGEYTVYMRVYNHIRLGERPIVDQEEDVIIIV